MVEPSDPSVQIEVPTGLPMGRIELGLHLETASLEMARGALEIREEGSQAPLRIVVAADQPLLLIETDRTDLKISCRPAQEFIGDYLKSIGHEPPELFDQENLSGWIQPLPADPCLCLACGRKSSMANAYKWN